MVALTCGQESQGQESVLTLRTSITLLVVGNASQTFGINDVGIFNLKMESTVKL